MRSPGPGRRRLTAAALALACGCAVSVGAPVPSAVAAPEQFQPGRCLDGTAGSMADPWQARRLGLTEAHTLATGEGVRVAILDTGVDTVDNPVLSQRNVTDYNVTGYDKATKDEDVPGPSRVDCGQGSALATLIGGQSSGFTGVAPNARILGIRTNQLTTDNPDDPEPVDSLVDGVQAARDLDADVLLVPRPARASDAYRSAIRAALADGMVVVAAAGDRQQTQPSATPAPPPGYPATEEGVISVGGSGADDLPAPETGLRPDNQPVTIGAPGAGVVTAYAGSADGRASWVKATGSALAAAQVAGVAALLRQREPSLTSAQVAARLRATADVPGVTTPDLRIGAGVVNPTRALAERPGAATSGRTPVAPPPADPRDRPDPHRLSRLAAVLIGAGAVVVVGVLVAVAAAVPGGRRRRWRGGE